MAKAIGIDLGTTNSVVAVMEGGKPTVIINSEGNRLTPSVVGFNNTGERLVGQIAKRQAVLNPENTIYSAKRFIGRRFSEVQSEIKNVPYKVVPGPNDAVRFLISGKQYSPEEISSMILRRLADDAAKYLGEKVTDVVITVPAYFNDAQRQATKDAGKIAGLNVLRIINEPTAAALAYGLDKKTNETILVFDLGGGTFDVSILDVGDGVFEVHATAGDTHLGGDDFDKRLVDWMGEEFLRNQGIDLRKDRQALQRLTEAAEKAKIELSTALETTISLPFVTADATGPKHLEMKLTRAKFDQLTADLVERCVGPVKQALGRRQDRRKGSGRGDSGGRRDAHSGGASSGSPFDGRQRTQPIRESGRSGCDWRRDSSRRAGGRGEGRRFTGRNALVARPGDAGRRNDEADRAQHHHSGAQIGNLFNRRRQSDRRRCSCAAGRARAGARQSDAGPFPVGRHPARSAWDTADRGHLRHRCQRHLDRDGQGSRHRQRTEDHGSGSTQLSKDEIDRMVKDAQAHSDEDKRRKEEVEARNSADAIAYQVERQIRELGDRLPVNERARAEQLISEIREQVKNNSTDVARLRQLASDLQQVAHALSSAAYSQAAAGSGNGPAGSRPNGHPGATDDVIDAEFKQTK